MICAKMYFRRKTLLSVWTMYVSKVRTLGTKTVSIIDLTVDKEGIAEMRMQRPPVNSINLEFLQEMGKAVEIVERKDKCKGIVLASAYPAVFSAGVDLAELHKPDEKRLERYFSTLIDLLIKLYSSNVVTAVAINGHTAAGGCILATACEYRVMVNKKIAIGLNDTAVGVVPAMFVIALMNDVMGKRHAEYAVNTSAMFSPDEALKVGLVDEIALDDADAVEKCKKFIRKFDNISPSVRGATKQKIRHPFLKQLRENKQEYAQGMVETIINPQTQRIIDEYVTNLKLKKALNKKVSES